MRAKKLLSMLLVVVFALGLLPVSAFAMSFSDTQGHWAEAAIDRWSNYGVVNGVGDGKFNPDGTMTRAEAAQVFMKLMGLTSTAGAMSFSDVPANAWYAEAVAKVTAAGIMNGVGNGLMNPGGFVTREEFFVMFARAMGLKEQSTTSGPRADGDSWANGYINALTDKGYVKGDGNGVNALANINRASVMSLLDQTIKQYVNTSGSTTLTATRGVILVAAKDVTLTGTTAADIVIAQGADGGTVAFEKATVTGVITAQAANAKITSDKDSAITTPVINGANTTYTPATTTSAGGNGGSPGGGDPFSGGGGDTPVETAADAVIKTDLSDAEYDILEISSEVGDGEILLERITVGTLRVKGGGSNSIKVKDSTVGTIVVNKPNTSGDQETRIELNNTSPTAITASTGTIIDTAGTEPVTVGTVTASGASSTVTLKGAAKVAAVSVSGSSASVTLDSTYSGAVEKVTVSSGATVTADGGSIATVAANGNAVIGGSSETAIQSVTASGTVTVNAAVAKVEADNGAKLKLGDSANITSVEAKGSLNISSVNNEDAGKIGTLTATTGTITVDAPTATIATVEAKAVEGGTTSNNSVSITVTSGTVTDVKADAANTTISGSGTGTVANVTANSAVSVNAGIVEKVTVATDLPISVSGASAEKKIDVEITSGAEVNIVASSQVAAGIEFSATGAGADASKVTIKTSTAEDATVIKTGSDIHVHVWSTTPAENEGAPATCTTAGTAVYKCTGAGADADHAVKTVAIAPLGHQWNDSSVTTQAGHTTTGVKTYTCSHDSTHTYPEPIPATGHVAADNAEWKFDDTHHWHECTEYATDQGILDKAAHNWVDVITTDTAGKVWYNQKCSVCEYETEKQELTTKTYLQLATTTENNVTTVTGNKLVNSNDRSFYSSATVAKDQTVELTSTIAFIDAATTVGNWTIAGGAANGLELKAVALSDDNKTATLTFTPKNTGTEEAPKYSVSGALRITPKSACFDQVSGVNVTVANEGGYLKAGVPAPKSVSGYTVTVDRWGNAAAIDGYTTTGEGEEATTTPNPASITAYYVTKSDPSNALASLAKTTYQMTTQTAVEAALEDLYFGTGTDGFLASGDSETSETVTNLQGSKTYNGASLVAVKYSKEYDVFLLDGYGVSGAINVYGHTPDTLVPMVDVTTGTTSVTRTTLTALVSAETDEGKEGAEKSWQVTTPTEQSSDVTYNLYLIKAATRPSYGFDTLTTAAEVETALGGETAKKSGIGDLIATGENAVASGWTSITKDTVLTKDYNGMYILAVLIGTTNAREKTDSNDQTFENRVAAAGLVEVKLPSSLDDVIDLGIAAVNSKMTDYAVMSARDKAGAEGAAVTITITDGSVEVGKVKTDIIDTLVNMLKKYSGELGLTSIVGKISNAEKATLDLTGDKPTDSEVVTFVKALGLLDNIGSSTKISSLNGKSVKLEVKKNTTVEGTYTLTFAIDSEAQLDKALTAAIVGENENDGIAKAIEEYATIALSHSANDADTVEVTIFDVSTEIGKVYSDVAEKLVGALSSYATTYGEIWLVDGKDSSDTTGTKASTLTSGSGGSIANFVRALNTGNESETLQSIATSDAAKIGKLGGKSVQIDVYNETDGAKGSKLASYVFNFTVDFEPALETAINKAIGAADSDGIEKAISSYASIELTADNNTIAVNITNGTTQIGTVYSDVANKLVSALAAFGTNYGGVTLKDANNSSDTGTASSALTTNNAVADFVRALKCGSDSETLGSLLASSSATISALNGKSVQITVTDTANAARTATFTFSFTVTTGGSVTEGEGSEP